MEKKKEKKEAADWIENKEWRINGSTSLEAWYHVKSIGKTP
jgi:hypothetical protein